MNLLESRILEGNTLDKEKNFSEIIQENEQKIKNYEIRETNETSPSDGQEEILVYSAKENIRVIEDINKNETIICEIQEKTDNIELEKNFEKIETENILLKNNLKRNEKNKFVELEKNEFVNNNEDDKIEKVIFENKKLDKKGFVKKFFVFLFFTSSFAVMYYACVKRTIFRKNFGRYFY